MDDGWSMLEHTLHDPYNSHRLLGLRNRLFTTFNEFSKILKNALDPPVLKTSKKLQVKIEENDKQVDYIFDLDLLISEIKKELKTDCLNSRKTKSNVLLKKQFRMKLIQCYKLAIETVKVCSTTLKAGRYNPVQNKMKKIIQLISTLSLTTGKFMYGESFKEKRKESFDLVQSCKELRNILNDSGYEDTEKEEHNNVNHNVLDELTNKALAKNKQFSTNTSQLSIYVRPKPKLGSHYAQEWSKKSSELTEIKSINEHHHFYDADANDIKTAVEEFPIEESNNKNAELFHTKVENENDVCFDEPVNFLPSSKILTSYKVGVLSNNVGMYVVKENTLRDFPVKDAKVSNDGKMFLNISPDNINEIHNYKIQLKVNDNSYDYSNAEFLQNNKISMKEFLSNKVKVTNIPIPVSSRKLNVSPEDVKKMCKYKRQYKEY